MCRVTSTSTQHEHATCATPRAPRHEHEHATRTRNREVVGVVGVVGGGGFGKFGVVEDWWGKTNIPGHALHEKVLQKQIGVGTFVSIQERRALLVLLKNRGSTVRFVPPSV